MNNDKKGSLLLAWQVRGKHCLVIGGGDVALSRIEHLIIAQAKITVIAGAHPQSRILDLYHQGLIYKLLERNYQPQDLRMYDNGKMNLDYESITAADFTVIDQYLHNHRFEIVCCAIDDHQLSAQIYYQCKLNGLNANIADKPELCDFYFGSMINIDNLQIMISTNGKSPRLAKIIKDIIKKQIENIDLNKAIENLNFIRSTLRSKLPDNDVKTIDARMQWIKQLTDSFELKQWSQFNINPDNAKRITDYYPEYPPKRVDAFERIL